MPGAGADAEVRRGLLEDPMQQDQERQEQETLRQDPGEWRSYLPVLSRVDPRGGQHGHPSVPLHATLAERQHRSRRRRSGKVDNPTVVNTVTDQNPHSGWSPAPSGVLAARALGRQIGTRQWQRG